MRVFSPSVGKRVMVLMPDSPAVSFAQLSVFPAPNEVTKPRPVTTTRIRPDLSLPVAIFRAPSTNTFDECKSFTPPVSDAGYYHSGQVHFHWPFQAGRVAWRKETTMTKRNGSQCNVHSELRLQPVTEIRSGRTHGKIRMPFKKLTLLGRRRLDACRSRQDCGMSSIYFCFQSVP